MSEINRDKLESDVQCWLKTLLPHMAWKVSAQPAGRDQPIDEYILLVEGKIKINDEEYTFLAEGKMCIIEGYNGVKRVVKQISDEACSWLMRLLINQDERALLTL